MKNQKVAIVGAGICGLYLAHKLSQQGARVTIFEKKKSIGKYSCSGLFSERLLDFIPQSESLIQNRIKYALLHFPGKTIRLDFSSDFLVMEHFKLDQLVAGLIAKEKVKLVLGKRIETIPEGFDRVIGCDGVHSVIREDLGLEKSNYRIGIQGFVSKEDNSSFVEVWPTLNGFIWKIPRREEVEYGIMEEVEKAKRIFDQFLEEKNIKIERVNSAFIPQGLELSNRKDVALCGDAAGLTKPWSGGGVIWGLIAADILLKNFPNLLKYKKELKGFFVPRIFLLKLATKIVYFIGFNFSFLIPKRIKIENDFLI